MSYKDLKVWQKSIELVDMIYNVSDAFPKDEVFGLSSQLRRSAVSIPSNIAEGSQRSTAKDFANFILIAKGSLAEVETQMIICARRQYCTEAISREVLSLCDEIHRMLYSFYQSLLTQV